MKLTHVPRLAFALLALTFLACAAPGDVRMHPAETSPPEHARYESVLIDDAFEAQDQKAIAEAVQAWNLTLHGAIVLEPHVVTLSFVSAEPIYVMRITGDAPFIPVARPGEQILAFVDRIGGRKVWVIPERIPAGELRTVVMHELGHVLGADDRSDVEGLMYRKHGPLQWPCVDRATAKEVASAQNLRLSALSYCEKVPEYSAPVNDPNADPVTALPPLACQ